MNINRPTLTRVLTTAALLASLTLGACDFRPVYGGHGGDDTPVAAAMNDIAIDNIANRNGQMLRNDLIDQMYGKGRPAQPKYRLTVTIRNTQEDLGIQEDATSTLTVINLYGDFVLKDVAGKELLRGTAHSTSSVNKLSNQYATQVGRDDAYARTVNEVSQQIVGRLSLYFSERDRPKE